MAQLKDLLVTGPSRLLNDLYVTTDIYEDGTALQDKYGASLSLSGYTLGLKTKNGDLLNSITIPSITYSAGDGIAISSAHAISVKTGTGLTTDGNDAIAVDTNTIATQSWVTGKGYITSSGNTWRPVKYGSTTVNDKTTTLEFVAGNVIDLTFASGKLTINHESYCDAVTTQGLYKISIDKYGHIDGYTAYTDQDTKNTAGSTDTSSKIFLIGATSQAANPQTYSHDTCYVGTNGHLYSASKEVLVGGSNAASSVTITPSTTSVYSMSSAGSVTNGTAPSFTRGTFSGGSLSFAMDTTDTRKLKITFTAATHAADSFSAGTTPPVVTLPGRTQVTGLWNGYTAATAAAQAFTGAKS